MSYANNVNIPQFFSTQICDAADLDMGTFKNLFHRGVIETSDERRQELAATLEASGRSADVPIDERLSTGKGGNHLFSFRRLMQFVIVARLMDLGIAPKRAGQLAMGFTDAGEGPSGWAGEEPEEGRMPGELYRSGSTYLVVRPGDKIADVVNVPDGTDLRTLLQDTPRGASDAMVIMNMNEVVEKVRKALDLEPDWPRPRGRNA